MEIAYLRSEFDAYQSGSLADHNAIALPDEAYQYDATGNRVGAGKVVGTDNRLLSDERFDYSYDAQGNTIAKLERSSGNRQTFEFDHQNRMTYTETRSSSGTVLSSAAYRFDALGRRISRVADVDGAGPTAPTTETFVYDGADVWLEADESGTVTARHLHGDGVDDPIARYRPGQDAESGLAWKS